MKTEREIIDELGEWLCTDMEKDLVKRQDDKRFPSTSGREKRELIIDVAARIKWYRDNVL